MINRKLLSFFTVLLLGIMLLYPTLPVGADVSHANFYGIIATTNNNTAATGVTTKITGMNVTAMIAGGFLNSSANNCAIVSSTGTYITFQPGYGTNPSMMFNGSVGAGSVSNSILYLKNVTGGNFAYFPGSSGMSITDTALMEPGSSFSDNLTAFLDVSQKGKMILGKPGSYAVYSDNTTTGKYNLGNYSTGAGYPNIRARSNSADAGGASYTVTYPAHVAGDMIVVIVGVMNNTSTANITTTASGFNLLFRKSYNSAPIYECLAVWWKISDGTETTGVWSMAPNATHGNWIAYTFTKDTFTTILAGTSATASSANPDPPSNATGVTGNTTWLAPVFAGDAATANPAGFGSRIGTYCFCATANITAATEDPGTYTIATAQPWIANTIGVIGKLNFNTLTSVSGITSGLSTVLPSLSGGTFTLKINSTTNSTAFAGSLFDTTSNFQVGSSATLYITEYRHYKSGTLRCRIRYNYGATFTDLSGNGNTATPSFPTTGNNAYVSSVLSSLLPISEPKAPAFAVGAGPSLISTNITATETPNPVSGNAVLKYPLKAWIDAMGAAGNFPKQWLPTFISVFVLLALSIVTSYFLKEAGASSIFVKSSVNVVGYGLLVALHIFDWWMLIFFFIFEQAIWFAAKERRE